MTPPIYSKFYTQSQPANSPIEKDIEAISKLYKNLELLDPKTLYILKERTQKSLWYNHSCPRTYFYDEDIE